MAARSAARAPAFIDPAGYARHRPERTLLYQLVEWYYPAFAVEREFRDGRCRATFALGMCRELEPGA